MAAGALPVLDSSNVYMSKGLRYAPRPSLNALLLIISLASYGRVRSMISLCACDDLFKYRCDYVIGICNLYFSLSYLILGSLIFSFQKVISYRVNYLSYSVSFLFGVELKL